jgi:DNA-binding transcriptional ArsR family regulator
MKTYAHPKMSDVALESVMHALSDPCRVAIVRALLKHDELACNEFPVKVSKATLSHHMDVLRAAGLIKTRVEGTKCLSAIRSSEIQKKFPALLAIVAGTSEKR